MEIKLHRNHFSTRWFIIYTKFAHRFRPSDGKATRSASQPNACEHRCGIVAFLNISRFITLMNETYFCVYDVITWKDFLCGPTKTKVKHSRRWNKINYSPAKIRITDNSIPTSYWITITSMFTLLLMLRCFFERQVSFQHRKKNYKKSEPHWIANELCTEACWWNHVPFWTRKTQFVFARFWKSI